MGLPESRMQGEVDIGQQEALAAGLGEKDTSVVFTLIERLAALKPVQP